MSTNSNKTNYAAFEKDLVQLAKKHRIKGVKTQITSTGLKVISSASKRSHPQNRVRTAEQTKTNDKKNSSGNKCFVPYHYFMDALKSFGKPGTTRQIGEHLKKINKEARSEAKKWGDDAYMQLMYNSSSYLVERNEIGRRAIGHRKFEYFLKEWGKNKKSKPAPKTGNRTKISGVKSQTIKKAKISKKVHATKRMAA